MNISGDRIWQAEKIITAKSVEEGLSLEKLGIETSLVWLKGN